MAGAYAGLQAFRTTLHKNDADVLREEFDRHRVPIESSLAELRKQIRTLSPLTSPLMPLPRIQENVTSQMEPIRQAVDAILVEARDIDERKMFPERWTTTLLIPQKAIEIEFEKFEVTGLTELSGRVSISAIVSGLTAFTGSTRALIDSSVRTSPFQRALAIATGQEKG